MFTSDQTLSPQLRPAHDRDTSAFQHSQVGADFNAEVGSFYSPVSIPALHCCLLDGGLVRCFYSDAPGLLSHGGLSRTATTDGFRYPISSGMGL